MILLQWSKSGGTKANLPVLVKQCLTIKRTEQSGGNWGLMTPGRIAELERVFHHMYPRVGAWEAALRQRIKANQDHFRGLWPAGSVESELAEDFWQCKYFYVFKADQSWQLEKAQNEKYSREGELGNKTSEGFAAMEDLPFQPAVEDGAVPEVPVTNVADQTRGKQIASKLKRLGESIGKAIGQTLSLGSSSADSDSVVKKVQKEFMSLRAAQADAYTKEEHKALVATIDGLFDQLAMAFPTMPGLQKAPSKRRVDAEEPDDAASKRAKG